MEKSSPLAWIGILLFSLAVTAGPGRVSGEKASETAAADGKEVEAPEFYLAEAKGPVTVVQKGSKKKAAPPQSLGKDDRILTGKDGFAYLQFKSGGTVEVAPQSEVKVSQMEIDSKTFKAKFKMTAGRMRTILKKLTAARSSFEIEAGGVVCGVRGTTFEVGYDKDKKSVATKTYEGSVYAKSKGKETVVDKGFGLLIGEKGDPVLGALSSEEMKDALEFIKISDDLDKRKEMFQKKLKQSLIGTLMEGGDGMGKSIDDAKSKLPFSF